jgi:hypothetical protein
MKTSTRLYLTFSFSLFVCCTLCQGQEYQKIQLKDNFTSIEDRANYNIWRTDFYICTGIAYAKSLGKTANDFAVFVGNHHSCENIKGKGLEPAVQILNGLINLYGNGKFEIISESDSLVTMRSNRPYKNYFKSGPIFGVSVDEFESCLWGHIVIMSDLIGLRFKYKIESDQIVSSLELKK